MAGTFKGQGHTHWQHDGTTVLATDGLPDLDAFTATDLDTGLDFRALCYLLVQRTDVLAVKEHILAFRNPDNTALGTPPHHQYGFGANMCKLYDSGSDAIVVVECNATGKIEWGYWATGATALTFTVTLMGYIG